MTVPAKPTASATPATACRRNATATVSSPTTTKVAVVASPSAAATSAVSATGAAASSSGTSHRTHHTRSRVRRCSASAATRRPTAASTEIQGRSAIWPVARRTTETHARVAATPPRLPARASAPVASTMSATARVRRPPADDGSTPVIWRPMPTSRTPSTSGGTAPRRAGAQRGSHGRPRRSVAPAPTTSAPPTAINVSATAVAGSRAANGGTQRAASRPAHGATAAHAAHRITATRRAEGTRATDTMTADSATTSGQAAPAVATARSPAVKPAQVAVAARRSAELARATAA